MFDHILARAIAAPPLPPEAVPAGLLGRSPAVHAAMEQAWRSMFLGALFQGVILGFLLALAVIVAVIARLNLRAALKGAIVDATRS